MPVRFGDATPTKFYFGDSMVSRLYFGDNLVWMPLQSASTTFPGTDIGRTTWVDMASWTVQGWGVGTVLSTFSWGSNAFQWASHTETVQILVNGSVANTTSITRSTAAWNSSVSWTGQLNQGDIVKVQAWASTDAAYASVRTVNSTNTITPA